MKSAYNLTASGPGPKPPLTPRYTDTFLSAKRNEGDVNADLFVKEIFDDPDKKKMLQAWLAGLTTNESLSFEKNSFSETGFIREADQLPHWADPKLMKAGSELFAKHSQTIMSLLGLLSLPYCYTAANGAMVLYLSDRMRNDTTKRLNDTASFVWEVMAPNGFAPGGKAFAEILKVRMVHAAVRRYTIQSGKWDNSWGLPVNQEDMAGTNLSFSYIVIRGLRMLGFTVNQYDQVAFIHLWSVIGYLSGLNEDIIPESPKAAQILEAMIAKREFRSSAHGAALTRSLTNHITAINTTEATTNDILGLMRYLLKQPVADMLAISAPDLSKYKVQLFKTTNLLKSLLPSGDLTAAYHQAYADFKKIKPA